MTARSGTFADFDRGQREDDTSTPESLETTKGTEHAETVEAVEPEPAVAEPETAEVTDPAADPEVDEPTAAPRKRRIDPRALVVRALGTGKRKIISLVVLAALLLAAAGGVAWWRLSALPKDAAFAVGNTVVTIDQLDSRVQTLQALYGVQPPTEPNKLDSFRRDAAKSVALSTVLDQETANRGIVISDKEAGDVLNRFVESQFGPGGRDAFLKTLGTVGTSEAAVIDEIKRQLAVSRLTDQVVGTVSISDDDLKAAFEARKNDLGTPETRSLRHIVVDTEQQAKDVVAALNAGTPFEQLAAERSLDASTKNAGGNLGQARRDQLDPAFGDPAFAAAQGAVFGPVQTQRGWYVGRVDAITPPVPAEFDQVSSSLRQTLEGEQALDRWRTWLTDTFDGADVRYAADYRPADPSALPDGANPAAPK